MYTNINLYMHMFSGTLVYVHLGDCTICHSSNIFTWNQSKSFVCLSHNSYVTLLCITDCVTLSFQVSIVLTSYEKHHLWKLCETLSYYGYPLFLLEIY